MTRPPRLIRITTVPMSLQYLLGGQLSFMKKVGFDVLAVSADGKERESIIQEGIYHHVIPFTRKITPVRDLYCLILLVLLYRKIKPDIVHTHTPKAGLLGMVAACICRVPVRLHTVAGLPLMEANGITKWILRFTERITYGCAGKVYPNSKGLSAYIHSTFKIRDSKVQMIGKGSSNGIDATYFKRTQVLVEQAQNLRKKYGVSPGAVVFSFVGRIVRDKGIQELTGAFKSLLARGLECYVMLIGPLEQELDPLSEDDLVFLQTNPYVIMPGFQQDVRPWLLASDVFVFPSYREGFPNVVMQAACLEVPCIVSDINGCNEIIQHNATGLVVAVKNADALASAMQQLTGDRMLRQQFGKRSREFVTQNFSQPYVWNELLKEYQAALKMNGHNG